MSNDVGFACPVCRAKQTPAVTCRRCKADLQLLCRALDRVAFLKSAWAAAIDDADLDRAAKYERELRWLAPKVVLTPARGASE